MRSIKSHEEEGFDLAPKTGVQVDGTHIYFFCDVTTESIQDLALALSQLESQHLSHGVIYGFVPPINLHILSNGGDVLAGLAAVGIMQRCKVPIHTYVEGMCASAATLMSVSGAKRFASSTSLMLIHQLSSSFEGKHDEFKEYVENTDRMMAMFKKIYLKRITNESIQNEIVALLTREVMLSAERALELELIDEIG